MYRWMFNDGFLLSNIAVIDNLTMSILTIRKANDSNSGAYTCIVTDPLLGVVNRDTAYVEVTGECVVLHSTNIVFELCVPLRADPKISVDIEEDLFEVVGNSSVEIVCRYSTDFPGVTILWRRTDDVPIPKQATVSA